MGCTAIFVSQMSVGERGFGGPGVEHGVDGIITEEIDSCVENAGNESFDEATPF